jgi:CRP/FNR family transcriptional regulator, cyclic AMP receptor protein
MGAGSHDVEAMVARVDLFSGLSSRQVKKLLDRARQVQHTPGQEVAAEGLGALAFHLVLDGRASVTVGGEEVRTLGPGDHFGEISMIDGKPRSATVTATEPMTTLVVPHQEFERLLGEEPDFARALLGTLCARLREAEAR